MILFHPLKKYFSSFHKYPWNPSTTFFVVDVIDSLYDLGGSDLFLMDGHNSLFHTTCNFTRWANWMGFLDRIFRLHLLSLKAQTFDEDEELERIFINSSIQWVRRFVTAKNLKQLYDKDKSLQQNEILAALLAFPMQILDSERAFWFGYRKHLSAVLNKNLTFLRSILGDTPFWCSEPEDVENLLVEFESIAKAAWNFSYLSTFASSKRKRKKKFDAGIQALLGKIDSFLNEKLKNHSFKLLELTKTANSGSNYLHSPFIVDSLLKDLERLISGLFNLNIDDIKDQVETLIKELASIQTGLSDIQVPQVTDITELRESMMQIRGVAYEAEYLINTFVMGRLPTWYLNLRLPHIVKKVRVNRRGFQEIKKNFDFKEINIKHDFPRGVSNEAMRDPEVLVENVVIDFEGNITKILDDLVGGSKELKNVFIHGMPGIGKTTIAKKVYNDRRIDEHFDLRAWCVVSQTFDKTKVLNDILLSLRSKSSKESILRLDGESLDSEIHKILYRRRYLIVVDGVWHSSTWDDLGRYFSDFRNGSRILLTSRIKNTAPTDSIFHAPPLLSESQCFDLLVKKVFIKEPCPPELLDIAQRIASKCHGLPLLVVVVAGIMTNEGKEESTWKNIEANLNSYISDDQDKYMKILELSYEHLPDHLKSCFLYLERFKEDEEISMRRVIPLWIAEGFVPKKEGKSQEHVAEEYCSELINRSLLMIAKRKSGGGIKSCSIHDVLRDLCLKKAEDEKFLKRTSRFSICAQHSHLILHSKRCENFSALRCRSLTGDLWSLGSYVTQMPLLRVIDGLKLESSSPLCELEIIWSLVHLKYLSFSAPKFPIGLCMLVNLAYLCLHSDSTVSVPSNILKMMKLRHVCINTEAVFEKSCDESTTMNRLKSLSRVLIRNEEESEILKCSPQLYQLKCICDGSLFPDFSSLTELESLTMKFTSPPRCELTELYFPLTIKKLSLYGTRLPWEKMTIVGSLSNLHMLKILRCAFVGEEWNMKYGEFQELRFLRIEHVTLKQWITSSDHLPKLECLVLESVMDLIEIPSDIGNIETLETIEVCYCESEIEGSVVQIKKEQRDIGNEDLKVIFTRGKRLDTRDIEVVMSQSRVSRSRAIEAMQDADGDIIEAIMMLTT